jgi:hypothetical protein
MTATTTPTRFRYLGITDECVVCQRCGRTELRSTVVLAVLDEDGNTEDVTYYGSSCAARVLGEQAGGREVLQAARNATVATLRAALAAHERAELHSRFAGFNDDGVLVWTRPAVLQSAAAGVQTAVDRVAAIHALAGPVADAAAIGYPTREAVTRALRAGGWL